MEKLIILTESQWDRFVGRINALWVSADIDHADDILAVLELAKSNGGLGNEDLDAMGIDYKDPFGDEFRLFVQVDEDFHLATRMIGVRELAPQNGHPPAEVGRYVLGRLLAFRNDLVAKVLEIG